MDIFDRAQELAEFYRQNALGKHFAKKTADVEVGGIEHGICIDCEELISRARLAANPEAVRCIDCQIKKERKEQHEP
jgi:DnaK suppressor protein